MTAFAPKPDIRRPTGLLVTGLLALGAPSASLALQGPAPSDRDSAIRAIMAKRHLPSLAFAVVTRGGRVVEQAVYGLADLEAAIPATAETRYSIASATKSFAAVTLMHSIEAGKLRLADTLGRFFGDLPASWTGVTVSQILSHTSGLPDVLIVAGQGPAIAATGEEAMAKLRDRPLEFRPGEKWSYNQTNYYLVRRLIEWASGSRYEDEVRRRIFDPLGMTSTTFANPVPHEPLGAVAYRSDSTGKVSRAEVDPFPEYLLAAAGIRTSLRDWIRWLIAVNDRELLSSKSWDQLLTPIKLRDGSDFRVPGLEWGYGHGFVVADRAPIPWTGHSGGGRAAFRTYRTRGIGVLVLTNGATDPDGLADEVAGLYLPKP